jgi:hypothetical protein
MSKKNTSITVQMKDGKATANVWGKVVTLPLGRTTDEYNVYLISDGNVCKGSVHTIFGMKSFPESELHEIGLTPKNHKFTVGKYGDDMFANIYTPMNEAELKSYRESHKVKFSHKAIKTGKGKRNVQASTNKEDHSLDELEHKGRHWPEFPGSFETGKRR